MPVLHSLRLSRGLATETIFCVPNSEKPFIWRGIPALLNVIVCNSFDPLSVMAPITIISRTIQNSSSLHLSRPLHCSVYCLEWDQHLYRPLPTASCNCATYQCDGCWGKVPCSLHQGKSQVILHCWFMLHPDWVRGCYFGTGDCWAGCEWAGHQTLKFYSDSKVGLRVQLQWRWNESGYPNILNSGMMSIPVRTLHMLSKDQCQQVNSKKPTRFTVKLSGSFCGARHGLISDEKVKCNTTTATDSNWGIRKVFPVATPCQTYGLPHLQCSGLRRISTKNIAMVGNTVWSITQLIHCN